MRPRLLDLYCCQGGASAGYIAAGFDVVGVDLSPQPRYPWEFVQADAIEYLASHGHEFDAVHASPPCQLYSACQRIQRREHPDLIGPTRDALVAAGLPWVIENVEDARPELRDPVLLCGSMFPGLRTNRHRLFETSFPMPQPAHIPDSEHQATVKMGRPLRDGDWCAARRRRAHGRRPRLAARGGARVTAPVPAGPPEMTPPVPQRQHYVYSLIRVVPDSFVGEFINVGVIVGSSSTGDWHVRYVDDETHALQIATPQQVRAAREFASRTAEQIAAGDMTRDRLDKMHHDHRNLVQLSQPTAMVAESASVGADLLFGCVVVQTARVREDQA